MGEPRCIVFTSKPDVAIYDLKSGARNKIEIPDKMGYCLKLYVEKSETIFIAQFYDQSIGVFSI